MRLRVYRSVLGTVSAIAVVAGVQAMTRAVAAARDVDVVAQSPANGSPAPVVQMTAEEDRKRLMDLLQIASLRRGPDGNPASPNAANFDEAKANPYPTLPDPLVLKNGTRVRDAETWWKRRRPEIVEDFDREIYGRVPTVTPKVTWDVTATTAGTAAGTNGEAIATTTKTLVGHVDNAAYPLVTVDIQLTLTTPAHATGPVPVIMEFGFTGPRRTPAPPPPPGPTWQEQVLAKGWGYAILVPASIQADNGAGLTQGIIGLVNKGQPRKVDDWGALRAWAWGASRALDYFETDKAVDAKQVGIEGLSRYGKAALVTMAYDARFAIGFIGSSGEGGAKLHRRQFGELVENVAGTSEYHWMAGNFLKYAGPLNAGDLPIDAHELVALCAPRPVFIGAGSFEVEGGWVDQKGMFLTAAGAGPVYRLLGKKDLGTTEFPSIETALVDGEVAFRQHRGGHTNGPNWPTFLTYAGRYVKGPAVKPTPQSAASVALTFDDLPIHGPLPPGLTRVDIARAIIDALRSRGAPPVYGFVNAKPIAEHPEEGQFLQVWRDAGFPLGNHAFSHMDLHANPAEAFEQDVLANEPTLKASMGAQDWHWFRYPYLREGETLEKYRQVATFLKKHDYHVAEVTLSFDDYAYNEPYVRCLGKNDTQAIEWLKQSFLTRAEESLSRGQEKSRALVGRDVSHIMLLHVGAFQTVMFPRLLDLLQQRGFTLTTLEEASKDAIYATAPERRSRWSGTLLEQMTPPSESSARPSPTIFEQLGALCR
jgi:(4-O-methyl)-D-glucuronate---lignin esterase